MQADIPAFQADITVIGDEVESILTAVSAARANGNANVVLVRESQGNLGGLSTRGGLAYMDITPEYKSPLFDEFLTRTGVIRVALDADKAHQTLEAMMDEAGVTLISGASVLNVTRVEGVHGSTSDEPNDGHAYLLSLDGLGYLTTKILIDTTPDADVARMLGVPYLEGLGGVLGPERNFLGVSPVFVIEGIEPKALQDFEASLRARADMPELLADALPHLSEVERADLITRPTFCPDGMDYLDILNPVIGIAYHHWRYGRVDNYATADIWIDGANIALLPQNCNGHRMAFNGLIMRAGALLDALYTSEELDTCDSACRSDALFGLLLHLSHGYPVKPEGAEHPAIPDVLLNEMKLFERFLSEVGGLTASIVSPEALYVRQTLTLQSQKNMTARTMLAGGVAEADAIGTFSYWLDMRGAELWRFFPGEHLPKPVFNVGLPVALPPEHLKLTNLAFVSRSAGYSPLGQGAGRIVQHNALLGEAIGIAAALGLQNGHALESITPDAIRHVLSERQQTPINISGKPVVDDTFLNASRALVADDDAISRLNATLV